MDLRDAYLTAPGVAMNTIDWSAAAEQFASTVPGSSTASIINNITHEMYSAVVQDLQNAGNIHREMDRQLGEATRQTVDFVADAAEAAPSLVHTMQDAEAMLNAGSPSEAAKVFFDAAGIAVPEGSFDPVDQVVPNGADMNSVLANQGLGALNSSADLMEADSMVFAHLSYLSKVSDNDEYIRYSAMGGTNPDTGEPVTIGNYCNNLVGFLEDERAGLEAAAVSRELTEAEQKRLTALNDEIGFMHGMSSNPRYRDLVIAENEMLWSGEVSDHMMVIEYPDGRGAFFAMEGTDGTVTGWDTNFDYGGMADSPHQKWIRERFSRYAERYSDIDMGGHSRGGHLAVYALMTSAPHLADKVNSVWSLDGPGFSEPFYQKYAEQISVYGHLVHNIRPNVDFVGQIDARPPGIGSVKYIPLNTNTDLLWAHEDWNWMVNPDGTFSSVPPSDISLLISHAISTVMPMLSEDEFEVLAEKLWGLTRVYSDGSYGQTMGFDVLLDNLVSELSSFDFETLGAGLGTLAILLDRGLVFELLPDEWRDTAQLVLRLLRLNPAFNAAYIKIRTAIHVCAVVYETYVKIRQAVREKQRKSYLAQNPTAVVSLSKMQSAINCLQTAEKKLNNADQLYNKLYGHLRYSLEDFFSLGITTCGDFSLVLFGDCMTSGGKVKKMYGALGRVMNFWKDMNTMISGSYGTPASSDEIRVTPSRLKSSAVELQNQTRNYKLKYTNIFNTINRLHSERGWRGEDYNLYRDEFSMDYQEVLGIIQNMENYCVDLEQIASDYARLQEDSVREFQEV